MTQEATAQHAESESEASVQIVHVLMQFALAVRYRKGVVIIALAVSFLLCGLYYATATRRYGAKASLVLRISEDTQSPGMATQAGYQQSMLPTYQDLIKRSEVIKGAIDRIPREHRLDFARRPPDEWVRIIQSNLSVVNARRTNIVEVSYRSKDPNAAVTMVNAVVDSYKDFMEKTYKGTAGEIRDNLLRQKDKVDAKLAQKEAELCQARGKSRNLGIDPENKVLHPLMQRVVSLNERVLESEMHRRDLETRLNSLRSAVDHGEVLAQQVFALADLVNDEVLLQRLGQSTHDLDYRNDLMQSRINDLAELRERERHFGPANPMILELRGRIRETENVILGAEDQLKQQAARIQDSQLGPMLIEVVQQKLNSARELEASVKDDFDRAEEAVVNLTGQLAWLGKLERECNRLSEDRDMLRKQISEIDLEYEGQDVRAHIVDVPKVNDEPVSPKLAQTILVALVLGLGLGLAVVYVLDILDDRFRSMEEMQILLGVPVLTMVRELETREAVGIGALQAYVAPNATESEAFRTLRTALSLAEQDTHQIVISSPEPGDGKTTVLANLAVAVAQSGKKTLLIDADLRRPGLTALLGMRGIAGLSSVIRDEGDVVQTATMHIRASGLDGLDVLPAGPRPGNPAELLGSQRFSELLAWAESVYDQVFIDSPPTLATSDTAVIGRLVNGVMLVVQPSKNRRRAVIRSVESFARLKIPLLGLVVNRIGSEKDGGYYGYGGYYGDEYAYRYGEDLENDDEEPEFGEVAAVGGGVPFAQTVGHPHQDNAPPSRGIVPRRVA
ncbi:MAG: polysaccharide biosynthesis tyrosine autokinase [Planctomycetota bacterium]